MAYESFIITLLLLSLSWLIWRVKKLEKALDSLRKASLTPKPALTGARKRKRRYLVFLLLQSKPEKKVEVIGGWIADTLKKGLGEFDFSWCRPHLVYFSPRRSRGILRVEKESIDKVVTCLSLERHMGDSKVLFVPLRTTGTLRKARKYLFDRLISG